MAKKGLELHETQQCRDWHYTRPHPSTFPHLTIEVDCAASETTARPQVVINDEALKIPPDTTKTITASGDHPSELKTTDILTPVATFTEIATLLISASTASYSGDDSNRRPTIRTSQIEEMFVRDETRN